MLRLIEKRERHGILARSMLDVTTGLYFLQRMKLDRNLCVHNGCVNTICWNEKGTLILSGSDDQHLAVTDPFSGKNITKFRSGHRSNIFSAKFMPFSFDKEVISCSGSGEIFYTNIDREDLHGTNRFDCHFGSAYKLLVVPNEAATFLSCGDDGTVRFFDLRVKTSCSKFSCEEDVVILLQNPVTSMAVDPVIPYQLAVSTSDGTVRLYDRRMMKAQDSHAMNESLIFKFAPPMAAVSQGGSNGRQQRSYRVTSLNFRPGSHDLLVNYSSENIYLFNTYDIKQQMVYRASMAVTQSNTESNTAGISSGKAASTSKSETQTGSPNTDANATVPSTPPSDAGSDSDSRSFKPIKRLRLRGDWSDTGPDARPEGEESGQNIMQRMSDLLTRMLNSRGNENEVSEQDDENDDAREEQQQPSENQAQASARLEEHNDMGHSSQEETDEAAAMLRSVMTRNMQFRTTENRAESSITRSSISSEDMVSYDLSLQSVEPAALVGTATEPNPDDSAHSTVDVNPQEFSRDIPTWATTAAVLNRGAEAPNVLTALHSYQGQESGAENSEVDNENQESISTIIQYEEKALSTHCQFVLAHESEACLHEDNNEQDTMLHGTSSSSSDTTQTTVIPVTWVSCKGKNIDPEYSMDSCLGSVQHMPDTEEISAPENKYDFELQQRSSDSDTLVLDKSIENLHNKKYSFLYETERELQAVQVAQEISTALKENNQKPAIKTDPLLNRIDPFDTEEKNSLANTPVSSSSLLSSDSFSMASLWSSSPSATTVAIAGHGPNSYEGSGSQQTLCNISAFSSLPSPMSSTTGSMVTCEQGLAQYSLKYLEFNSQTLSNTSPDEDFVDQTCKNIDSESVSGTAKEANSLSPKQDYQVHFSSGSHKPCKSCKKAQISEGKGKGQGKSSNVQKSSDKGSHPDQFVSYNSGKMRVSDDAPPNLEEAGTSSGARTSGSNTSERRRRHGHSLPPTGKFQLFGLDDDEDNDEDYACVSHRNISSVTGTRQENKERLSKAAKKIQEAFRQRREAREIAKMKDVDQPRVFMKFSGHRNCRTVIKEANFYGDNFVMSGSDCGRIMFWERETGRLVMYLDADKHVVNCVQPNPFSPVLASSGIDYDVKIWCPLEQDGHFDEMKAAEVVRCNERMLEVTRDTVTVPAAFMLRILASLSQMRNGQASGRQQQEQQNSGSNQE